MAKTLFENGTPLTPEVLNRLNNPKYAMIPSNDGEIPYPPADIIPEIAALQDGLAQEAAYFQHIPVWKFLGLLPLFQIMCTRSLA